MNADELLPSLNGHTDRSLIKHVAELTARVREARADEAGAKSAYRQALQQALHQALENYHNYVKSVDLSDYKAFSRVLTAAIFVAPAEFVEPAIKLREQVDQFIAAVEASMQR